MDQDIAGDLTPGAHLLIQSAQAKLDPARHRHLGVHHWLLALVERHSAMAEDLTVGLNAAALRRYLHQKLERGDAGAPLSVDDVRNQAAASATRRGKAHAGERDLASVILAAAGYALHGPSARVATGSVTEPATGPGRAGQTSVAHELPATGYRPRSTMPTPTLEQYGRDLTREALEGRLPPVVGRLEEIELVIETLCRRTKRNPVLVGPAGVGKTAIVEGLAQRIVRGDVPEVLKGVRMLALLPSLVVAGASVYGELQTRMKSVLAEASQDGVVLFIDEVHQVIGAGGAAGTGDIASLLEPALARGELACIAATTDDEYRRFIEPDAALERRFQPIRVQELTPEQTLDVLRALRDDLGRLRHVTVSDDVLHWLVDFAGQFLRNRYFPDKAVDLLEQCVAHAVAQSKAAVEADEARAVAERLIGMPLELGRRLAALRAGLAAQALLDDDEIQALVDRLQVTMRGMDVRPARPNAVVLLTGDAAANSESVARVLADALFGGPDREVMIDLSRFVHPEDVTMLIGAPPGYIGYSDALPLHRLAQTPWCVLRLEQIAACHPQIRAVLTQGLASGVITDARGKRLYLSDAVVLLTSGLGIGHARPIGFRRAGEPAEPRATRHPAAALGEELAAQVDLVCAGTLGSAAARRRWIEEHVLADLARRYRRQGLQLRWDETLVRWLAERDDVSSQRDWERLMDETIGPLLVTHLAATTPGAPRALTVRWIDGRMQVEHETAPEGGT
ncbi:MAG: AAA family ATPase [Armatimonadota bacterium]|nr:AAA family ATPase [Armatimonadota bacterium]